MKRLELVWDADFELCLGRVAFEDLDGKPQKSPPGGHSVYVWRGHSVYVPGTFRYLLRKN